MDEHGHDRVEPSEEAQESWGKHVQEVAPVIRLRTNNYMVHVNQDDGSRFFIPYAGGYARYVAICREVAAEGYKGFEFD
jgi:hypothetical protein